MPLPRAGRGQNADKEIILLSEASQSAPTNNPSTAGAQPGLPEPATTNISDTRLGVQGGFRPTATTDPTVVVQAMRLGVGAYNYGGTPFTRDAQGKKVADKERPIGRYTPVEYPTTRFAPVPRFGVARSNYDQIAGNESAPVGIHTDFRRWPRSDANALVQRPVGSTQETNLKMAPRLCVSPTGTLLLCAAWTEETIPQTFWLEIREFDPDRDPYGTVAGSGSGWSTTPYVSRQALETTLPPAEGNLITGTPSVIAVLLGADLCVFQGTVYVVVGTYLYRTNSFECVEPFRFWVYRVDPSTNPARVLTRISDAICPLPLKGQPGSFVGMSLTATEQRMLLAVSYRAFISGTNDSRQLLILRSPDGVTWGSSRRYTAATIKYTAPEVPSNPDYLGEYEDTTAKMPFIQAGDVVRISGFVNAAHNGIYVASARATTGKATFSVVGGHTASVGIGASVTLNITRPNLTTKSEALTKATTAQLLSNNKAIAFASDEIVTGIHFPDGGLIGVAVTNRGKTLVSNDGGVVWNDVKNPCRASEHLSAPPSGATDYPLYCVYGIRDGGSGPYTFYAGGMAGVVRSVDNGATWKMVHLASAVWTTLYTGGKSEANWTWSDCVAWRAMRWTSTTTGVLVGDDGWIFRTTIGLLQSPQGGTHQAGGTRLQDTTNQTGTTTGEYYSVSTWDGLKILVGGDSHVHENAIDDYLAERAYRFMRVRSSTAPPNYTPVYTRVDVTDVDPSTAGPIVGIAHVTPVTAYAIDRNGNVFKCANADQDAAPVWTEIAHLSGSTLTALAAAGLGGTGDSLVIAGRDAQGNGVVWRSFDSGTSFVSQTFAFPAAAIARRNDNAYVVGGGGISTVDSIVENRVFPSLLALPSGAILLAVANLTQATIEVYRAADDSGAFVRTWSVHPASATTGGAWVPSTKTTYNWPPETPWPSLTRWDNGDIILSAGQDAWVSLDDGLSFMQGTDSALTLPVNRIEPVTNLCSAPYLNASKQICALPGGMIFAVATGLNAGDTVIVTWVSREFTTSGTEFMPILPSVPQFVGVDGVRVIWNGTPQPGDRYTIAPRYDYDKAHLAIESPSIYWRSRTDTAVAELVWDRRADGPASVHGEGRLYDTSGLSLFGTNFRRLKFAWAPDDGAAAPGNPASGWTEVDINCQLIGLSDNYAATAPSGSGTIYNVLKDTELNLVPSQFKPGLRTYYVTNMGTGKIFRIVDNSQNTITVDLGLEPYFDTGTTVYLVFGDRFCNFPTVLQGNVAARFMRYLRVRMGPTYGTYNKTADGYYKIGTPIIGSHDIAAPYMGLEARHRFSAGFAYQASPSTVAQAGLSQVASVRHFGRGPAQKWTLSYEGLLWHDRDQLLNGLVPRLRQAFALVLNGEDLTSVELVRLADGPTMRNTAGDRYSLELPLEEVV